MRLLTALILMGITNQVIADGLNQPLKGKTAVIEWRDSNDDRNAEFITVNTCTIRVKKDCKDSEKCIVELMTLLDNQNCF